MFAMLWIAVFPAHARQSSVLTVEDLTLEQRVAQMFIVHLYGARLNEPARDFLRQYQPGGVALLAENLGEASAVAALTTSYQQVMQSVGAVPLLVAVDQEGGPITHLREGFTVFPTPALITATGDPDYAFRVGQAIGSELRAVGVNMNLAPVADLETNPRNAIIRRRSFGSDPGMVAPMVAAFSRGLQSADVLSTAKHFPGHGATSDDSHTMLPVVDLDRVRLDQTELVPFRAAIDADIAAVMAAHIWYPALESVPNTPASLSYAVLTGLLRSDLGFEGLIVTDALDMDAVDMVRDYPAAVLAALEAGADLFLSAHVGPDQHIRAIETVVQAVRAGHITEARINASVERLLAAKARFRIASDQPVSPPSSEMLTRHADVMKDLFEAGITVAYDRGELLPVKPTSRPAVIFPATRVQIQQECSQHHTGIRWVGVSDSPSNQEILWAVDAANRSDQTIVFTQNADENAGQQALVRALPPATTAVVALWSPYDWLAFPEIAAYVLTYSPARPAVPAVCKILFGQIPQRGKLSITLGPELPAGSGEVTTSSSS